GSAALTIAVVGSSLIVYLLHPGAAPGDSRQPGELPSSVQTRTYDDWARATPISPDAAPIGTAGTFACETSSDLIAANTVVFSSEAQAREGHARICASAALTNPNQDSWSPTATATCDIHGVVLNTIAPRESASPDWVYVADLDECIPARW